MDGMDGMYARIDGWDGWDAWMDGMYEIGWMHGCMDGMRCMDGMDEVRWDWIEWIDCN